MMMGRDLSARVQRLERISTRRHAKPVFILRRAGESGEDALSRYYGTEARPPNVCTIGFKRLEG